MSLNDFWWLPPLLEIVLGILTGFWIKQAIDKKVQEWK